MEAIEFVGKNTEEAIYKACEYFGTTPEKLDIQILSTGSTGIFGLVGGKKAKIKAFLKEQPPEEPLVDLSDLENDLQLHHASVKPAEPEEPLDELDADTTDELDELDVNDENGEYIEADDDVDVEADDDVDVEADDDVDTEEDEPILVDDEEEDTVEEVAKESEAELVSEEESEHIKQALAIAEETLDTLIKLSGITAEIRSEVSKGRVLLDIRGDSSGLLIGKKGKTLDAYQFILSKIVSKRMDKKVLVVVDSEDYRERRKKSLAEMAVRLGEKAKRAGRPITISPMNAHDRRVIHLALQDDKQLRTRSKGEGLLKRIIILPQRALRNRNSKRT